MMARRWVLVTLIFSLGLIFTVAFTAEAQEQPKTCPMIVSQALNDLGTNCANESRNTSCYGHEGRIRHTAFTQSEPTDFYSKPGDRADLSLTETIQTGSFELLRERWGLNVMNVNADLPTALGQKGVVYIQFGGVEVENGVPADQAVQLLDNGVNVTTTSQTNLLTWYPPTIDGHASNIVMAIPAGSSLSVDAINPAADSVRAVFQGHAGWVSKSALDSSVVLGTLPTIGPDSMTPMQSFYFRTGIGGILCDQAPSLLFVQGPKNSAVDVTIFQQPVRIDSTVVLKTLPGGDQLGDEVELITLAGLVTIYPGTDHEVLVPAGTKSILHLCTEFQSLGTEGDPDEKAACGTFGTAIPVDENDLGDCPALEGLPSNLVNYVIKCPIVIQASGDGGVQVELVFPDQSALDAARDACANDELPKEICDFIGASS